MRRRWLLVITASAALLILFWFLRSPVPVHEGIVRDEHGPLADVRVRLQTTDVCTRTDFAGHFRLPRDGDHRITAWKEGYFIAGPDGPLDLRLKRLPTDDHDDYTWIDPQHNCATCHAAIYEEWATSAHARSATGKQFLDVYRSGPGWSLLDEHPLGAGVCAACHAPAIPADDPAQLDLLAVRGPAAQGVHCDYCHKISGVENGTIGLTHGRFNLRLLRPAPDEANGVHQITFGPLDDVDRGDDTYSPLYRDSRYCASCHEGIVFGVPVYTTYSEWLDSPARHAGKQCQTCHMKPTGTMPNFAPGHGGRDRNPQTLGNHRFFDVSQEVMLKKAVAVSAQLEGGEKQNHVTVRIGAADVGHRVPTGFVDRNLVLVVDGTDATGKVLPALTGPILPALAGAEAGRSGRVYAKLLSDAKGRSPVPFWRDDAAVTDNRLTPGRTDELVFDFPQELSAVRVRVLYRRFWPEVARSKQWPAHESTVIDRTFAMFAARDKS